MSIELDPRSKRHLRGVHPDLARVIEHAAQLSTIPFRVIEGARTVERQKKLVAQGYSKTMNSRHIPGENGLAHAADVVPIVNGKVSWSWPHYRPLAEVIKRAARELGVPVEWGGDWKSFQDGPHWQLPWALYPSAAKVVAHLPRLAPPSEHDLLNSRTMQGSAVAAFSGVKMLGDGVQDVIWAVQQQQYNLTSGSYLSLAIGLLAVGGALYAAYARWDDAGRPSLREVLNAR